MLFLHTKNRLSIHLLVRTALFWRFYEIVRQPEVGLLVCLRLKGLNVCYYVEKYAKYQNQTRIQIRIYLQRNNPWVTRITIYPQNMGALYPASNLTYQASQENLSCVQNLFLSPPPPPPALNTIYFRHFTVDSQIFAIILFPNNSRLLEPMRLAILFEYKRIDGCALLGFSFYLCGMPPMTRLHTV